MHFRCPSCCLCSDVGEDQVSSFFSTQLSTASFFWVTGGCKVRCLSLSVTAISSTVMNSSDSQPLDVCPSCSLAQPTLTWSPRCFGDLYSIFGSLSAGKHDRDDTRTDAENAGENQAEQHEPGWVSFVLNVSDPRTTFNFQFILKKRSANMHSRIHLVPFQQREWPPVVLQEMIAQPTHCV